MKYEYRQGMKIYCEMARADFMPMCDWYVVRENDGGYLGFVGHPDGDAKVLAVAHLDYLQSGKVHRCNRKEIVSSALDDRAGAYIALELLDVYGIKADVLLTDCEESGGSTISMLGAGMLDKYNWIVELDRRGDDAVTYGYTELSPFLSQFWDVKRGSCSDISKMEVISPVSAFNLGVGYYREHSEDCHLKWSVLHTQLEKLRAFYNIYKDHRFGRKHSVGELAHQPKPVWQAAPVTRGHWWDECHYCGQLMAAGSKPNEFGRLVCPSCVTINNNIQGINLDGAYECEECHKWVNTTYFLPSYHKEVCGDCFDLVVGSVLKDM